MSKDFASDLWTEKERRTFGAIGSMVGLAVLAIIVTSIVIFGIKERGMHRKFAGITSNESVFLSMGDSILTQPTIHSGSANVSLLGKVVVINSNERELDRMTFLHASFYGNPEWYADFHNLLGQRVEDVGTVLWLVYGEKVVGRYTSGTLACRVTCDATLLHVKPGNEQVVATSSFTGGPPPEKLVHGRNSIPEKNSGIPPWEDIAKWLVSLPRRDLHETPTDKISPPAYSISQSRPESSERHSNAETENTLEQTAPVVDDDLILTFFAAIQAGDIQMGRSLIAKEPQLLVCRDKVSGGLPVHWAAQSGNEKIVRFLLTHREVRTSLNVTNNSGQTAFDLATSRGHETICNILKQFGATTSRKAPDAPFLGLGTGTSVQGR